MIRERAETLANDILVSPPHKIYESAMRLEDCAYDGRSAMDRVLEVVRRAHLHTLESAYQALARKTGRTSDAEKLEAILGDYRRVRSVIDMSRGHIEAALGSLEDQRWRPPQTVPDKGIIGYTGGLIAKA